MRLMLKVAKSVMEKEEGMNHLWVQLDSPTILVGAEKAELTIDLPNGLYRAPNLNGHVESAANEILLDLSLERDVLVELYTEAAVDYDEARIVVALRFKDAAGDDLTCTEEIVIRFAADEEVEETVTLDMQVIERVKELGSRTTGEQGAKDEFVILQPSVYAHKNKYDYLVEKYRIDY